MQGGSDARATREAMTFRVFVSSTFTDLVAELDNAYESVVLIGHNPGMSEFVDIISPYLVGSLPTCGVVRFAFDADSWSQILTKAPTSAEFDYPRVASLR